MAGRRPSLELLVTQVASELMAVNAATMAEASREVLHTLVDYFGVDTCFLRHHDLASRTTTLIAEWPVRQNVPVPDPLGVIHFAEADSVTAAAEQAREPIVVRPEPATEDYQKWIDAGAGVQETSALGIPLLSGDQTTGVLGLVKFGDLTWSDDEVNALKAIAALFAQLQARVAAEELLLHRALHDDLTGLLNRRSLIDQLRDRLEPTGADSPEVDPRPGGEADVAGESGGEPGPVVLLFLDIDRLKALNDFLGHAAGDDYLNVIAERLRGLAEPDGLAARIAGDEFAVVPAAARTDPLDLARQIRTLVNEPVTLGEETVSRGVTIGVAQGYPGRTSVTDLMRQADQATLLAKSAGGNDIHLFTDEMRAEAELRDDIELRLRRAIETDELVLHYQPEIDLRDGTVVAVEALVRWRHPTRGLLQPGTFIQVAEETNLAGELGRWVMRHACAEFAQWRAAGIANERLVLRINVSPVQLVSLNFANSVDEILKQTGVPGSAVCFEITEHAVVQDLDRTQITLRELKTLGVKAAIDDFGTGFSSLSHLKSLQVDALKIDRGFVRNLGLDAGDLAIVKSIVGLANSFNLDVVAEGVETPRAARMLRSLGCYRCQGFLYARPLPVDDLLPLLTRGTIPLDKG
ncbi:MAG: GGDEF and EAL domain-containing protein [Mycobacteriaceae bacterium]|nr:GGDEF and EAL domain-containing protein [Mycobacteriaceae bacterium]